MLSDTCNKASVQLNFWTVTLPKLHAVELVSEKMLVKTEILFDTLRTFAGCCARRERLHQFSFTIQNVVLSNKLVSAALLIILWSTVQVCHALPFQSCESVSTALDSEFFIGAFQAQIRCRNTRLSQLQCLRNHSTPTIHTV